MYLYGKDWKRRDLEARVPRIETIGGVKRFQFTEGPESGGEFVQVRTGAGLTYYINTSRALDISLAEFGGVPFSWQSVNGDVHPAYYNPGGLEWLRSAVGGLLMTCGLTQVGSPCEDNGEYLSIHGRIHHIAARNVATNAFWKGDDYRMQITGKMEEGRLSGEHLCLTRQIQSELGKNYIIIDDEVENIGFQSVPHMILYHFNFGFPFMDKETTIKFPSRKVIPREHDLILDDYDLWQEPEIDYAERVYYHEIEPQNGENNLAFVKISNPAFPSTSGRSSYPLSIDVSWRTDTLPRLIEWKMPAAGMYALGIEPANCYVEGRVKEKERGSLVMLEPGEKKQYHLEISMS